MNRNRSSNKASNLLSNLIGGRTTQEQKQKYKKLKHEVSSNELMRTYKSSSTNYSSIKSIYQTMSIQPNVHV